MACCRNVRLFVYARVCVFCLFACLVAAVVVAAMLLLLLSILLKANVPTKFYLQMSLLSYIFTSSTSSSHFACSYSDTRELSTATAEEVEYEGDGTVAADGFAADYVTPEGNFESFAAYTVKNTTNATDADRTTTNPV